MVAASDELILTQMMEQRHVFLASMVLANGSKTFPPSYCLLNTTIKVNVDQNSQHFPHISTNVG